MRPRQDHFPNKRHAANALPGKGTRTGLARALSKLGFCSRSEGAELIRAGRVTLNGAVRRDPETPVHIGKDKIAVDAGSITPAAKIYLMLNKPRGIVTTASDENGRATVYDFIADKSLASPQRKRPWIAPVGRLDKASEGLLLFTNDSEWAARILAPESHLDKIYHVQIAAIADEPLLDTLRQGVQSDGERLRVKHAGILRHGQRNSWLEITLDEGKNRHIRRMMNELGLAVLRLVRVSVGPLLLGDLPKGNCRPLTAQEKRSLDQAVTKQIAHK